MKKMKTDLSFLNQFFWFEKSLDNFLKIPRVILSLLFTVIYNETQKM